MSISENIKKFRLDNKLTQKELAEKCSLSESSIKYYETGMRNPKRETLKKIANALNVKASVLADEDYTDEQMLTKELIEIFKKNSDPKEIDSFAKALNEFINKSFFLKVMSLSFSDDSDNNDAKIAFNNLDGLTFEEFLQLYGEVVKLLAKITKSRIKNPVSNENLFFVFEREGE